ncbi:MAG TPA: VWA domain-containing protein [Ignisphaera sp.]|uniref:VWA domain-containing protein n=1 Tax=Ignisphaera aggregans TaxID=334771 RepID=A0A833DVD4_9CREN|nr:VWA domain-containing protein [Ignisphaera sp.]HIP57355.1 VWA domain-containing protein [Ignisphaera aggregans]
MPGVLKNIDYTDPFTRYKGQKIIDVVKKLGFKFEVPLDLAIDIHYALYLPFPELVNLDQIPYGSEKHYFLIKSLLSLDETKRLRYYTVADSFASVTIGAMVLMYLFEELNRENIDIENKMRGSEGSSMKSAARSNDSTERSLSDKDVQSLKESVQRAVAKALENVETVKEIEHLVYGYRAGIGHTLSLDDDAALVLRLVRNTDIKLLLERLARMPSISSLIKRKKVRFSRGEIEGYIFGSDLERVVPTEFAYPDIYFYAKLADNRLLLYDKFLSLSLGPLYVLIDKSGSMEGEKIRWAKATALALFIRSRIERRPFYIRFFDSEPFNVIKVRANAKPSEVLELLEYIARVKSGGGTDISKAIITACNDIVKHGVKKVSDIILITDGEDRIAKSLVKRSLTQASARLISVMIMGENEDLKKISDKYFRVVKLSDKEMLSVVEA